MIKEESTEPLKTNNNEDIHKIGKYKKREPLHFYYTFFLQNSYY
jgi:hypothetical protein